MDKSTSSARPVESDSPAKKRVNPHTNFPTFVAGRARELQKRVDAKLGRLELLEREVIPLLRAKTRAGSSLFQGEIVEATGCDVWQAVDLIELLEKRGVLTRLPFNDGLLLNETAGTAEVQVDDVLALAKLHVDDNVHPPKGRRGTHESRACLTLTSNQLKSLVGSVSRFRTEWNAQPPERQASLASRVEALPRKGDPVAVTCDSLLQWDPTAQGGIGDWRISQVTAALTADVHRRKFQERANKDRSRGTWSAKMARASVGAAQGDMRLLCNFAASHGLIGHSPATAASATIYAAEWAPQLPAIVRWLAVKNITFQQRQVAGVRTLAIYATRVGGTTIANTDWGRVVEEINKDLKNGMISVKNYRHARSIYRHIYTRIAARGQSMGTAAKWPSTPRLAIVPGLPSDFAITGAASLEAGLATWSTAIGLQDAQGVGFVNGYYGIRAYFNWACLDALLLGSEKTLRLPKRSWAFTRPDGKARKKAVRAPSRLRPSTVANRWGLLARLATELKSSPARDLRKCGLESLVEPEFVRTWVENMLKDVDAKGRPVVSKKSIAKYVDELATIAGSFVGLRARQRVDELRGLSGDDQNTRDQNGGAPELAVAEADLQRFENAYTFLWRYANEIRGGDERPSRAEERERLRRRNLAVARAWRGSDNTLGIEKIATLRDIVVRKAGDAVEGRSLDEQAAAIASGELRYKRTSHWAELLRFAGFLTLEMLAPLRTYTTSQITTCMWRSDGRTLASIRAGAACASGAVILELPGAIMKSRRDHDPALMPFNGIGVAANEADFLRPLWEVLFAPEGARDFLLMVRGRDRDGNRIPGLSVQPERGRHYKPRDLEEVMRERIDRSWQIPSPYLLPAGTARTNTRLPAKEALLQLVAREARWERGAISSQFTNTVLTHAEELNLDPDVLRSVDGALGAHVLRRLYGTAHAPTNLVECSRRLDHTDIGFTHDVYCSVDESTFVLTTGYRN